MRNDFINELKSVAMESIGVQVAVDPYAGSSCAEELLTLDHIDEMEVAMESYTESLFGEVFADQELALESAELSFAEIAKFNGELASESVANAVKRGAYGVKIQAKKVIQKIIAVIKSIFTYLTTANGKFKSYNKLFKKYREKLLSTAAPAKDKDADTKEVTIKVWESGFLGKQHAALTSQNAVVKDLNEALKAAMGGNIPGIISAVGSMGSQHGDTLIGKTVATFPTINADTAEEAFDEAMAETKSKFKEELTEEKEKFNNAGEKTERTFDEAKKYLLTLAAEIEKVTREDHNFYKNFKNLDKTIKKVGETKVSDDAAEQRQLRLVGKMTPLLNMVRQGYTVQYKLLTSAYQGVLTDMAKVISAGKKN